MRRHGNFTPRNEESHDSAVPRCQCPRSRPAAAAGVWLGRALLNGFAASSGAPLWQWHAVMVFLGFLIVASKCFDRAVCASLVFWQVCDAFQEFLGKQRPMLRPLLECCLARKLKHGILWPDCKWLAMHLGYEIVNLAPKLAVRRDWKCCFNDTGDSIGGVRFEIWGEESVTAQHCFFKLSRAFVGQEESHEQVQVCASVLSFFADVCHGHVVMAPKSIIQQSKNLRTIQIQEFYERLHSEVSSSELRNAGSGLQAAADLHSISATKPLWIEDLMVPPGVSRGFHESYPEANAGKPIVGAQVQDLQGRPLANIFGATLTAAKAEQSLVKLCS